MARPEHFPTMNKVTSGETPNTDGIVDTIDCSSLQAVLLLGGCLEKAPMMGMHLVIH